MSGFIPSITRQLLRPSKATTSLRSFSVAARRMAGGDTGAPRSGGAAQGDTFTRREKANEDYYVRQEEQKKLAALKKKIAESESQLSKDRKEAEDIVNNSQK